MKKILGLDLGTTSIGWAYVQEAENENEQSSIVRLGVRISQLDNFDKVDKMGNVSESKNPLEDFASGKGLSPNAGRTKKRGARRNLQRYKQRRESLIEILTKSNFINSNSILTENGKDTSFETLKLRALATKERIEKEELARVFLTINKKRGYKSNRKAQNEAEGQAIDGMTVAIKLYDEDLTPGQYCLQLLKSGKKVLPDFYKSDLKNEFRKVWDFQKQFYPEILTESLYGEVEGANKKATWAICDKPFNLVGVKRIGSAKEKKIENYQWRDNALNAKLELEELIIVLQEINNNLNSSSDYLGAISDRSKELHFNNESVGEYLYKQVLKNPHKRLKGQVFYRLDYLHEFEKIWETQKQFHPEMNDKLKEVIRDITIFYQRRLKSQKGLISFCEFESKQVEIEENGKKKSRTIGSRVCPKSSPLFQEFKIWQNLSHLIFTNKKTKKKEEFINFEIEEKQLLFNELNIKGSLKKKEVFELLGLSIDEWDMNYSELQGNTTNQELYSAFLKIIFHAGHELDFKDKSASEIIDAISSIFETIGIDNSILKFDAEIEGKEFEMQKNFQLWHLLYSYEGDDSNTGNDALYKKLHSKFGIENEYAQYFMSLNLQDDYGSLSAKAIRKIFPFIKEHEFSKACALAGYNHSHSITKEENENRVLKTKLKLLPKNSLRNPVVEKILNQMVNVINAAIDDPELGTPDEIRIELARELKKSAKEREEMSKGMNSAKILHDEYRELLRKEFRILNPTKTDIIKYKLYKELEKTGYKTLYTNNYIRQEQLFSKEIDIEHIIPKARLYDDSFSNKTLEFRQANIDKSDETAVDYIEKTFGEVALEKYKARIEKLFKDGGINKAKYKKLLMKGNEIGEGFIERDLRESQYIAKKAKQMLLDISRTVISTSGSITDTLRNDWGLIDIMKELNIEKYRALGLTVREERKEGKFVEKIVDWTKRNDHRHHAMDALTVAFTKHNHIQYLNNLNARKNEQHKNYSSIIGIEKNETYRDDNGKRRFKSPMENFRVEAKKHLESILISHKAKNKVVTRNQNKMRNGSIQNTLTPRGQLHKETVYGKSRFYQSKMVKLGTGFNEEMINQVANLKFREAIKKRFAENENNPKKAFGGKNSPSKNPIFTEGNIQLPEKIKLVWLEDSYTIRKDISPELKIEKIKDVGIKRILENRLAEFDGKAKEAFVNLEKNPIWLNKEKGIPIKRVTISGVNKVESLHTKKDHLGNDILDENGNKIAVDFVSTGNNHHVAIYRDDKGNLQEEVVSLFEAVARVNEDLPIINREHNKGWELVFTLKQNEMFVFPSKDFDPTEIDLLDPNNFNLISPHLFRVQKISTKNYVFNHHLETRAVGSDTLKNKKLSKFKYFFIQSESNLESIIKVRINHLGKIVKIGEY